MKTMQLLPKLFIWGIFFLLFSCETTSNIPTLTETQCYGSGSDNGSMRLKAWGYGKNTPEAIEQAKRNAVYDVIFNGIKAGGIGCTAHALAPEGPEKNIAYFDEFFRDNGPYLKFVTLSGDGSIRPEDRIRAGKNYKVGMYVVIDHLHLKQKLQEDGMVKKLGDGFMN